mgnify:CR=1 FL=1
MMISNNSDKKQEAARRHALIVKIRKTSLILNLILIPVVIILITCLLVQVDKLNTYKDKISKETITVEPTAELIETPTVAPTLEPTVAPTPEPTVELTPAPTPTPEVIVIEDTCKESLGTFTITYYCACEDCCDEWAKNRPIVEGKPVVVTASGAFAEAGVTVAVDPSVIPYGTVLYIEGVGYRVAQDCGGSIKGNKIDVYLSSHADTVVRGIHTAQVYRMTDITK